MDQSRPVPLALRCPVDEGDNSHSFHPQEKTEVSLVYSYCMVTAQSGFKVEGSVLEMFLLDLTECQKEL